MKIVTFFPSILLLTLLFAPVVASIVPASGETNEPVNSLIDESNFSLSSQETPSINLLRASDYFQWSTYLGGSYDDYAKSVKSDSQNNAIIIGHSSSSDFPILNGLNKTITVYGSIILAKFDPSGALLWSTYFGDGVLYYNSLALAIDHQDNIVITGTTFSENFTVLNGYNETIGSVYHEDAFISKFDPSGNLIWSTFFGRSFLGGPFDDVAYSIAVDSENDIIVAGETHSNNFPTYFGYNDTYGYEADAFISKIFNPIPESSEDETDSSIPIGSFLITMSSLSIVIILHRRKKSYLNN